MARDLRSMEGPLYPDNGDYDPIQHRDDLQVPEGMSVKETEDWVSGDKLRAQAALKAEQGRDDKGRSTLVAKLEALAADETGGIAQEPQTGAAVSPDAEGHSVN